MWGFLKLFCVSVFQSAEDQFQLFRTVMVQTSKNGTECTESSMGTVHM